MVAVEVDVDRVVDAGRVRVGDEERRPLVVELEQVVVGMVPSRTVPDFVHFAGKV